MNDISSLKFTEADGSIETDAAVAGHLISDIENRPAEDDPPYTAAALKAAFDYLATHVLGPRINDLIDALLATVDGAAGADNIGATAITGVTGATVQAILEDLKSQIDETALGTVPDGSIDDGKLSAGSGDILARFTAHTADFASHFRYLGVTGGSGTAYTATDASFTFDTTKVNFLAVRAGVDCGASPTLAINGGTAYTLRTNAASALTAAQMLYNGLYYLIFIPSDTAPVMVVLNPDNMSPTLTASRALVSDAAGKISAAIATAAEIAYLSGVTSGIQAQLNGKQPAGSYAASVHTHPQTDISALVSTLAAKLDDSEATVPDTINTLVRRAPNGDIFVMAVRTEMPPEDTYFPYVVGIQQTGLDVAADNKMRPKSMAALRYSLGTVLDSAKVGGRTIYVSSSDPGGVDGDIWIQI